MCCECLNWITPKHVYKQENKNNILKLEKKTRRRRRKKQVPSGEENTKH